MIDQLSEHELANLKHKVQNYDSILKNTMNYRSQWDGETGLKNQIQAILQKMVDVTNLDANIEIKDDLANLEAVVLNLGTEKSGLAEKVSDDVQRSMIKHNGSLIYQQLFNGKIIVVIHYPFIENYGQPRPPKTIAIYRPEELKPPYFVRHVEEFISDISNWEDFDDDDPQKKIGFKLNFENPSLDGD